MNVAIDTILDEISKVSLPDKEIILDIMEKRLIEEKRNLIYGEYKKAVKDYRTGNVKTGNVDDLFESIND
jgi:hypothetical protein